MTRYYARVGIDLIAELACAKMCEECRATLSLPDGFRVARVLRVDQQHADVEVEDEYADPALEGKTVTPWFQAMIDGTTEIIEREVMHLAYNQIRMEES